MTPLRFAADQFPGLPAPATARLLGELLDTALDDAGADAAIQLAEASQVEVDAAGLAGFPLADTPDSVLGATTALWQARPDLARQGAVALTPGPPWTAAVGGVTTWVGSGPGDDEVIADAPARWVADLLAVSSGSSSVPTPAAAESSLDAPETSPIGADGGLSDEPAAYGWVVDDDLARTIARADPICEVYGAGDRAFSEGVAVLLGSVDAPPTNLMPLTPIDERSVAAVVVPVRGPQDQDSAAGAPPGAAEARTAQLPVGTVVRWFTTLVPDRHQVAVLDLDVDSYLTSLSDELHARGPGLEAMGVAVSRYEERFLRNNAVPKAYERRPYRLACQNVVVGLAEIRHESAIDGLAVSLWQTAEVAHLAAHEAARALTATILCDAFRNGSTLEIVFNEHPENGVPASLRRFARVQGLDLDCDRITPEQARHLFRLVTPMPRSLAARVDQAIERGAVGVERLCYTLLDRPWSEIELEWLLATSPRCDHILLGGSDLDDRPARQAEWDACVTAIMVGDLFNRLDSGGSFADGERNYEDARRGVTWEIDGDRGTVGFNLPAPTVVPWTVGPGDGSSVEHLTVLPRAWPDPDATAAAQAASERGDATRVLVPAESYASANDLRHPDRRTVLDRDVADRLDKLRIGRR